VGVVGAASSSHDFVSHYSISELLLPPDPHLSSFAKVMP
jgi:hypothetical protein